jgi:hypothetical protein
MNKLSKIHDFLLLLFLLFAAVSVSSAQQALTSAEKAWVGEYEFFDAQKTVRKNSPSASITYKITIYERDDKFLAKFEASGEQTDDQYECTIKILGNQLNLFFLKDLSGGEKDMFKPLKQGDSVASLIKTKAGKKIKYLFKAGDYKIDLLSARAGTPIYFRKTK